MATYLKPPEKVCWNEKPSVFLAGTIDNGVSPDWQLKVEKMLDSHDLMVLNPRREAWDASWRQSIDNPLFKQQVEWELEGLDRVDEVFMFFAGASKSPITLLELGLCARKGNLTIVCEPNFWRRGNIEVIANRFNIPVYETINEGMSALLEKLTSKGD